MRKAGKFKCSSRVHVLETCRMQNRTNTAVGSRRLSYSCYAVSHSVVNTYERLLHSGRDPSGLVQKRRATGQDFPTSHMTYHAGVVIVPRDLQYSCCLQFRMAVLLFWFISVGFWATYLQLCSDSYSHYCFLPVCSISCLKFLLMPSLNYFAALDIWKLNSYLSTRSIVRKINFSQNYLRSLPVLTRKLYSGLLLMNIQLIRLRFFYLSQEPPEDITLNGQV
jgi:hypothetical protein